jgi:hypothetical protein
VEGTADAFLSSFLMSEASEYRGGGDVNFWSTSIAKGAEGLLLLEGRQRLLIAAVGTPETL